MASWPDPGRVPLEEAISWFRARVPITPAGYQRLAAAARRRAFTVAGVTRLDLILDVWRAVDAAVAQGQPLEEFQKAVSEKLEAAWGGKVMNPGHRVETIYRTNLQGAYAAGRHQQQTDPDVVAARPYWMYDALLDSRTSSLCRSLHGTILRHDDPWWQTHYPPNHFNCRSGVRTLTEAGARRRGGVSASPPVHAAPPGFQTLPGKDDWQPDLSKYPPKAVEAYRQLEREFNAEP